MNIIGIDLGTTTSEVAYYKNGEGIIIKNIQEGDSTIIPSVVLIMGDDVKVGVKAKNQMVLRPNNTISEIKRFIGTDKVINIDGKTYTPVKISSMILKRIKEIAEFYIGEEVCEAVITVPANFNDRQRKDTKKAGELAGFKVDRIINEPTAAAIAYGINKLNENMNILVYDFGGGTIDVTVLELYEGILDVKSSRGNNNLGGKDIDEILIKYIQERFMEENNIELDVANPRVKSILKSTSEECKKSLSFENETEIIVPYICVDKDNNPLDLNMTITSKELENMCKDIINKTEAVIDDTLKGANLKTDNIKKVILVGGSTRMPCVQNMIIKKFGIKKVARGINNDEVVAIGASIQGAIKSGIMEAKKNLIVLDACSHTLGVEVLGKKFNPIILRDSKLPAQITKRYKTVEDNQEFAEIRIYEGEEESVSKNSFIDTLEINNIPKNKMGMEEMDITFKYDLNGILDVLVKVVSSGKVKEKKIKHLSEVKNVDVKNVEIIKDDKKAHKKEYKTNFQQKFDNKEVKKETTKHFEYEEDENQVIDEQEAYRDVANLTKYINEHINEYEDNVQKEIRSKQQDLLVLVQKSDFKKCRKIELEIIDKLELT